MTIQANTNLKLEGKYRLVVKHADGSETDTGLFNNLIQNSGLDGIGGDNQFLIEYAVVGTSAAAVLPTQSELVDKIGDFASYDSVVSVTNSGPPNYISTQTRRYSFNVGAIQGTIAEVGIGPIPSGQLLFSRALVVDGQGNPTTITLISTDQLIIYYQLAASRSTIDSSGSFTVSGVNYTYTMRAALITALNSAGVLFDNSSIINKPSSIQEYGADVVLGPITGNLFGSTDIGTQDITPGTYVDGSYQKRSTARFASAEGNPPGGIKGLEIRYTAYLRYQVVLDKPIPKTNQQQLTLDTTISWSR